MSLLGMIWLETAWEALTTAPRSSCSTGVPTVTVEEMGGASSARPG